MFDNHFLFLTFIQLLLFVGRSNCSTHRKSAYCIPLVYNIELWISLSNQVIVLGYGTGWIAQVWTC